MLQQTPSAQCFESHSASALHETPGPFGPQLPPRHLTGATQSASELHVALHWLAVVSQRKGAQTVIAPARQAPEPSHTNVPATSAP